MNYDKKLEQIREYIMERGYGADVERMLELLELERLDQLMHDEVELVPAIFAEAERKAA